MPVPGCGGVSMCTSLSLNQFLEGLNQHEERVPLPELVEKLEVLDIELDDVQDWVHFGPDRYRRNLMYEGSGFQALILCWLNGQRSPIHDHEGSSCGVKVLKGVMTETVFDRTAGGQIIARHSRELHRGRVCGSQDADIHQVSNLQDDGGELVTLHIYSPPLNTFNIYSLTDPEPTRVNDPIYEFIHGAGI